MIRWRALYPYRRNERKKVFTVLKVLAYWFVRLIICQPNYRERLRISLVTCYYPTCLMFFNPTLKSHSNSINLPVSSKVLWFLVMESLQRISNIFRTFAISAGNSLILNKFLFLNKTKLEGALISKYYRLTFQCL